MKNVQSSPATKSLAAESSRRTRIAAAVVAVPVAIYILAAYSSLTRPIWIDEFLHFALGSHRSSSEAWITVSDTVVTFNHGQTGVHMMVDYWLLRMFGASAFWLRLPSMLAGAFLLFAAVRAGLRIGFGPVWTVLLLAGFFVEHSLMYYAGEARPYLPFTAAVVGTFSFYLEPHALRTGGSRIFGAMAIGMGVLIHPYFPLYWLALGIFTFFHNERPTSLRAGVREFIRHCDPWISVSASVVCFVLAKLTWMRGSPEFHMDPFQWIRPAGLFATFTKISHFEFLGRNWKYGLGALIVAAAAFLVPRFRRSPAYRRLASPLLLIVLALLLSLIVSAVSYHREYWVLPRQWVASTALVCLGFTWFAFELARLFEWRTRYAHIPVVGAMVFLLGPHAKQIHRQKLGDLRAFVGQGSLAQSVTPQDNHPPVKTPENNDEWVAAANANLRAGGPVWPLFRKYYGRPD